MSTHTKYEKLMSEFQLLIENYKGGISVEDADKRYAFKNHTHTLKELGAAAAGHNHDDRYLRKELVIDSLSSDPTLVTNARVVKDLNDRFTSHTHDDLYSKLGHTHTPEEIGAATSGHNHDARYSLIDHRHDGLYAASDHTHTLESLGAASIDHDHDEVYSKLTHEHDDRYSQLDHNHDTVYIKQDQIGVAGGVPGLGDDGKIPLVYLPDDIGGGTELTEEQLQTLLNCRTIPDLSKYGTEFNEYVVGAEILPVTDPSYLCIYPCNELASNVPLDATGRTTAIEQSSAMQLVEDAGAFEGVALRRSVNQTSTNNKLVVSMPEISGPFTLDIRFKAVKGSPGVGGAGKTYALAGSAASTPAGDLGYCAGAVSPFNAVSFRALGYNSDDHGKPWKVLDTPDWYWFRICRNESKLYVFFNGELINSTTNSGALITIPAGSWTFLPANQDSDVLVDEIRVTNTCEATENYLLPTESYGSLQRKYKLFPKPTAVDPELEQRVAALEAVVGTVDVLAAEGLEILGYELT